MNVTQVEVAFEDERGTITDILEKTDIDSVTMITCRAGSVRGNHYHENSVQFAYVLSGKVRAYALQPGGEPEYRDLGPGGLHENPPFERHAIKALEDSVLLVLTRGPRAGRDYEDDTFRVDPIHPELRS